MMAKISIESNEVAGVNLPANVVFSHNGSNTLFVGNHIQKRDDKEAHQGGTLVDGLIERMVLQENGSTMIYVGNDRGRPGRLVLTATGMMILMKGAVTVEPKP